MGILHLLVLLAAVWAVAALGFLRRKVKAYGKRTLFSKPAGDARQGIRYAFIQGMAPWAKESVMMNLPSYGAGMAFHAGVFTAFALLLAALLGLTLPGSVLVLARVLTLAGACFSGRVAGSLLHAVGLPELVTESEEDYRALALLLAREPALLGQYRQRLADNRATAPLFDTSGFTRDIETAYERMWQHWRNGEPAASF